MEEENLDAIYLEAKFINATLHQCHFKGGPYSRDLV